MKGDTSEERSAEPSSSLVVVADADIEVKVAAAAEGKQQGHVVKTQEQSPSRAGWLAGKYNVSQGRDCQRFASKKGNVVAHAQVYGE